MAARREQNSEKVKSEQNEKVLAQFSGYMNTTLKKTVQNDPKFKNLAANPTQEYTWMTSYLNNLDEEAASAMMAKLYEDFENLSEAQKNQFVSLTSKFHPDNKEA